MSLKWEGDKVIKNMESCIKKAMNQTMAKAVVHAKSKHSEGAHSLGRFESQTAILEGSIRPVVAARKVGDETIGLWGSVDVSYALVLELGGVNMPAFPFLRPAADAEYPKLAERIGRCLGNKL